ncbi:pyridoxamine 5'-phosphate oxidase family protein [Actinomadura luteofluorescens]|uniref:pyridoxamine 5'-phosphate oxidase family protein n=1 Tax=Actinomadura luteofluorescens TaxID=46163 RepID=UPI003631F7BF
MDALARTVIDGNRYMTLGTSEADHRPRLSPVYFTHAGYRTFYWVSSPDARHSGNIAARPEVAIVIYDSTVEIGQGRAVYIDAVASSSPTRICRGAAPTRSPGSTRALWPSGPTSSAAPPHCVSTTPTRPDSRFTCRAATRATPPGSTSGAAWTRSRDPDRARSPHAGPAAFDAVTTTVA